MSNHVSQSDKARFITREFAETIADKISSPYFRLHDRAQKMLADLAAATRGQGEATLKIARTVLGCRV